MDANLLYYKVTLSVFGSCELKRVDKEQWKVTKTKNKKKNKKKKKKKKKKNAKTPPTYRQGRTATDEPPPTKRSVGMGWGVALTSFTTTLYLLLQEAYVLDNNFWESPNIKNICFMEKRAFRDHSAQ